VRLILAILKSLFLWGAVAIVPAIVANIFFHEKIAYAVFIAIGLLLLISGIFANSFLKKILRPSRIKIGRTYVFAIEDPSSHAFATQALFSLEPSLWITRGALSLLSPEEITRLVSGLRSAARQGGLRFETSLTSWLIRITRKIPSGFREVLFFRHRRTKTILIRESARGVFWMTLVLLLESFYFSRRFGPSPIPEEILRKLEAESRRCIPRLPVALSSHSAVSPWPNAFLTLGRTCLLPQRAVNLKV
jgi:hypothetical protein